MDDATRAKERASILRFGFVVPLVVRENNGYEIVDGEHRWMIGREMGIRAFPCWNLGVVDDDIAKQLTPVLNELHGRPDDVKLGALLKDLLQRQPEGELRQVMPFSRERFDELIGSIAVDWDAIGKPVQAGNNGAERWVERVFRLPVDVAEVVDEAIAKATKEADAENDWQGLEFVCAEFLAR